jgi:hypothetical protein
MFIVNLFVKLLSNTIGKWSLPYVEKKFNLNHYFLIEKELSKLNVPFAISVVTTYGHGSNLLISGAQKLSKDKRKRKSNITHALSIVETRNGKFRAAEAMGPGIQEVSLLSAIGQRDEVKIRVPNPKLMNDQVCSFALDYIKRVLAIDRTKNIPYDLDHDLMDPERYDCSELIFHAVSYGFEKAGQMNLLKTVSRAGKKSWAPVEAEFSELFIDIYDSKKGFLEWPEI